MLFNNQKPYFGHQLFSFSCYHFHNCFTGNRKDTSIAIYCIQKEKQSSISPFKIKESKPNSRKAPSVKNLLLCIKENKI